MRLDDQLVAKSTEQLANDSIQRTNSIYRNGSTVETSTESLTRRHVNPAFPTLETMSQDDLEPYLGTSLYETFASDGRELSKVASGEVRVNSIWMEPVAVVRYYNDQRRFSELQLLFGRGKKISLPDGDKKVAWYVNGRNGKIS
ncbi:MAG: hypothetical protein R3C49_26270 [Planctomycetaceae bacterium]